MIATPAHAHSIGPTADANVPSLLMARQPVGRMNPCLRPA